MAAARKLLSVDYEIFGTVQGVFFRKYTKEMADKLKLVGWVKNTPKKTVIGQVQGSEDQISIMKQWLKTEGSPHSNISKCVFQNERNVDKLNFKDFQIVRKKKQNYRV